MNPLDKAELDKLVDAIDSDRLSGSETLGRLDGIDRSAAGSETFLYPALHRLEATGRLRAGWIADATGKVRRRYSKGRRRPI